MNTFLLNKKIKSLSDNKLQLLDDENKRKLKKSLLSKTDYSPDSFVLASYDKHSDSPLLQEVDIRVESLSNGNKVILVENKLTDTEVTYNETTAETLYSNIVLIDDYLPKNIEEINSLTNLNLNNTGDIMKANDKRKIKPIKP